MRQLLLARLWVATWRLHDAAVRYERGLCGAAELREALRGAIGAVRRCLRQR